jgi:hypothetical protein
LGGVALAVVVSVSSRVSGVARRRGGEGMKTAEEIAAYVAQRVAEYDEELLRHGYEGDLADDSILAQYEVYQHLDAWIRA